jgi:hypothetical protein
MCNVMRADSTSTARPAASAKRSRGSETVSKLKANTLIDAALTARPGAMIRRGVAQALPPDRERRGAVVGDEHGLLLAGKAGGIFARDLPTRYRLAL